MNDTGWEIYDETRNVCLKCGDLVDIDKLAAHHELSEMHGSISISPCDAKRISSDGP
jgi:hypothetical protein